VIGLVAAAWLALGDASGAAIHLPPRSETWTRIQSSHFTIFTNGGEGKARDIGLEFERLRAVLGLLKPGLKVNEPIPTMVYVFRNESTFEPFWPLYQGKPKEVGGLFQGSRDGNFISISATWNADPRPRVYHEFLHDYLNNNLPPQPPWFNEGFAEFYSTFRATESEAEIGRPIDAHVLRLRNQMLIPLDRLFAITHDSPEYNEQDRQGVFYAESWALVHYLMVGDPKRAQQLARFLELLDQRHDPQAAFREAFDAPDTKALLGELAAYIRGSRFRFLRVSFKELQVPTETTKTTLTWEESLAALGNLLAHAQEEKLPDAEAYFQAALDSKTAGPQALAGLGYVRMRQKRYDEARDYLEKAVAADSRDSQAHYLYGELLMRSLSRGSDTAPASEEDRRKTIETARATFQRSIELNPDFPEAHAGLGQTYYSESGKDVSVGIRELELAVKALPSRTDLALGLARLYERQGEEQKSEALLASLGTAGQRALQSKKIHSEWKTGLDRVNALLAEGKEDEAVAVMEKIVADAPDSLRPSMQDELDKLRAGVARNRATKKYNDAIAHWNRGELQAALSGFEEVASTATEPGLKKAADEKAHLVRDALARQKKH
jgi:tetratricopeptide (TPR) repeat protein